METLVLTEVRGQTIKIKIIGKERPPQQEPRGSGMMVEILPKIIRIFPRTLIMTHLEILVMMIIMILITRAMAVIPLMIIVTVKVKFRSCKLSKKQKDRLTFSVKRCYPILNFP